MAPRSFTAWHCAMDSSARIDRECAQRSTEVVDDGGEAQSQNQRVSDSHFCIMSSCPLSVPLQHCMKVALRKFPGFRTNGPPCANFVCAIPFLAISRDGFAQLTLEEKELAAKGMMSSAPCERNFRMPRENHVLASAILRRCCMYGRLAWNLNV